ncbi:hypothetical protein CEXT_323561 [Caerostris extrusa]|uniref:DUF5641 domain-containing protein n=1 Tax=Caerostris extrusa TaxID=172846 RepID=A0AAV4S7B8_CAEEX|nr:hypothetical protein CEXT_323561 [Caerostris extrusa]
MGRLPAARVTPTRVFNRVGVDFCGPFEIKNFTGRSKQIKEGDLVLIKNPDNYCPLKWNLARIIKIHPGEDKVLQVIVGKALSNEVCIMLLVLSARDLFQDSEECECYTSGISKSTNKNNRRRLIHFPLFAC